MKLYSSITGFFLSLLFLSSGFASAQSSFPYQLSWKRQSIIAGTALGLGVADLIARNQIVSFTEAEILQLDPSTVPAFERRITERYSEAAAHRSDFGLYLSAGAGIAVPVVSLTGSAAQPTKYSRWQEAGIFGLMWLETNIVTGLGTDLVKSLVARTRPFAYNSAVPIGEKLDPDARKSFFSGHTSITTANAFFAAKVFADLYPDSKWKPFVWSGAALVPAWVGLERVLAGKHFPTDVAVGYLFGAAIGYLIPELNNPDGLMKKHTAGMQVQFYPVSSVWSNGVGVAVRF